MGRPKNKLCWDNAEKLHNGRWKCKHCDEELTGAASTIRNHLSGQGNDIGTSKSAPSHIREEALKRTSKKRARSSPIEDDNVDMTPFQFSPFSSTLNGVNVVERGEPSNMPVQVSPFMNTGLSTDEAAEQELVDAFVKLSMSRNISIDTIHDSHFMTFLTRVAQHGLPPSFVQGNPRIIQNSLLNFEHEVTSYMTMVKESWKTTGCTMMFYDFDQGKNDDVLVVGFYSPKGFIFVEVNEFSNHYAFTRALKDHVLDLSMNDVTNFPQHQFSHVSKCLYQACKVTDGSDSLNCIEFPGMVTDFCVRQQIEQFYRSICEESKWVESLINKSEKIYQYIVGSSLYGKYRKTLDQERAAQLVDGKHAKSLSRLGSIMLLEHELRSWLSRLKDYERFDLDNETDISAIINNYEFWYDGKELLRALTPLSKIPIVMDTLIPTAGYLYKAIDEAKRVLETYKDRMYMKFGTIWIYFKRWVKNEISIDPMYNATAYLSPSCILGVVKWDLEPTNLVKLGLKNVSGEGVEEEALYAEMEDYNIESNNPFVHILISECKANHPVQLWYKHGSQFPLLQKCAIKLLSQPVFCLCDPIKKHMSQLRGTDNCLLRLNYKMMEEFRNLGDDIYQPIEF